MECWRVAVSALHDHAIAITHARVARRAIDVEALLASLHELLIQRKSLRQFVAKVVAMFAREEVAVGIKLLAVRSGHSPGAAPCRQPDFALSVDRGRTRWSARE